MESKKLFVGICNSQNMVPSSFFWSILNLRMPVPTVFARGVDPWSIIRNNVLINTFLRSDCDYYVKMDIDQVYPDDYFEKMVPLVEKYKVIGPLIFDRWPSQNFLPLVNWAEGEVFDVTNNSGIIEVPYYHTNCFFHREALEAVVPPHYEFHISEDGLKRGRHTDIDFMSKIRMAGFKLYANLDVVVSHIAEVHVNKANYERWNS